MDKKRNTTKLFMCDLNWVYDEKLAPLSAPQDWAFIDPKEYFDWHTDLGDNAIFCQAYASDFAGGLCPHTVTRRVLRDLVVGIIMRLVVRVCPRSFG